MLNNTQLDGDFSKMVDGLPMPMIPLMESPPHFKSPDGLSPVGNVAVQQAPSPPISGMCSYVHVAPMEPILVDTSSTATFIDTSVSIHQGRKSILAAAMDDHMMVVGKAGVGPLVYRRVTNKPLLDDPSDCVLPSYDSRILREISNFPATSFGVCTQIGHPTPLDPCVLEVAKDSNQSSL